MLKRDTVVIAPGEEEAGVVGHVVHAGSQMFEAIELVFGWFVGAAFLLRCKEVHAVAGVVVGHATQTGGFGLQLEAGDGEQPGAEVGAELVGVQFLVNRNEAALGDVVDVDAGWRLNGKPRTQGAFICLLYTSDAADE